MLLASLAPRKVTKPVKVRDLTIGGSSPISVQTMTKIPTRDATEILTEIESLLAIQPQDLSEREQTLLRQLNLWEQFLEHAPIHCDLIRLGIPDETACRVLKEVTARSPIPIIADCSIILNVREMDPKPPATSLAW